MWNRNTSAGQSVRRSLAHVHCAVRYCMPAATSSTGRKARPSSMPRNSFTSSLEQGPVLALSATYFGRGGRSTLALTRARQRQCRQRSSLLLRSHTRLSTGPLWHRRRRSLAVVRAARSHIIADFSLNKTNHVHATIRAMLTPCKNERELRN